MIQEVSTKFELQSDLSIDIKSHETLSDFSENEMTNDESKRHLEEE